MSTPTTGPAPSDLVPLALAAHRATAAHGEPTVLVIDHGGPAAVDVWQRPAVDHPADALVGVVAGPSVRAVGLTCRGTARRIDPAPSGAGATVTVEGGTAPCGVGPLVLTVVAGRDGMASVLGFADQEPVVVEHPPEGWVADVLSRTFGLPTPPPAAPVGAHLELRWLDRLARQVLRSPGRERTWDELGSLHPLAGPGPVLPPVLLALETMAVDASTDWSRLRRAGAAVLEPVDPPPWGRLVASEEWFDDGAFARWTARHDPPGDLLLDAVLDALPASRRADVLDALVHVVPGCGR